MQIGEKTVDDSLARRAKSGEATSHGGLANGGRRETVSSSALLFKCKNEMFCSYCCKT